MTATQTTRAFIARMKLEALRRQRDQLRADYDRVLADVETASGPREKLEAFYDGLRSIRLAGEPVHAGLPDLSAALASPEPDVDRWQRYLEGELDRGRARSEAVYVFGALLEETAADAPAAPDTAAAVREYLERVTAPPGPEPAALATGGLLDQLFDDRGFGRLIAGVEGAFAGGLGTVELESGERVPATDVGSIVSRIAGDGERAPELRAEAAGFTNEMSEAHVALRDAIEIALADPLGWRWPEAPVSLRPVVTGDRIRVHPDLDLVSLLVAEQLGEWFAGALPDLRTAHVVRRQRLDRLIELNAPEIIIANERRMFERDLGLLNDRRVIDPETGAGSIAARRDLALGSLWTGSLIAGSHYDGYASDTGKLVRLLGAEVTAHRITGRPVYVVRADLADCFASIDHRVLSAMAERLGVPEPYRRLLERFVEVPVEAGRFARGVPLGLSLSRLLVDQVLGAIELHVQRAGVMTARVVDDYLLWSDDPAAICRGHAALVEAVESFGLRLQPKKTGAAAIGAPRPDGLPEAPVRFNLLALGPEGFAVDDAELDALCARTRHEMLGATSVLGAVRAYNAQVRYLIDSLVVHTDLPAAGGDHMAACGAALGRFASSVVDGGVEAWLRARIAERCDPERPLPRAWLYWPVSAGGLGLRDALLELGAMPRDRVEVPGEPFDELKSAAWGAWYEKLIEPRELTRPRADAISEAQIADFIARGGELRGQTQTELGAYWRWVLTTHGPEIVERFGTFRFLVRKLVPLDLLSRAPREGR